MDQTLNLEWASHLHCSHQVLPTKAMALFHHLDAPIWVTSWHDPPRRFIMLVRSIIYTELCHKLPNVGL
ncbi:hypothetical protein SESBI_34236, partial [Sesbania bispinosa]